MDQELKDKLVDLFIDKFNTLNVSFLNPSEVNEVLDVAFDDFWYCCGGIPIEKGKHCSICGDKE